VLPTHSENFGMTVAEALSHGVPVITTHGAPWRVLVDQRCGWWIEQGEDPLVRCLEEALGVEPEGLASAGRRGRELVARDFAWSHVGMKMEATYEWLVRQAERPRWVVG
jgi:glycosyltransferase involved in cell wall biosynthesis